MNKNKNKNQRIFGGGSGSGGGGERVERDSGIYSMTLRAYEDDDDTEFTEETEEQRRPLKVPFSCYRHDVSASQIGNAQVVRASQHRPNDFNFAKFDRLNSSLAKYRAAVLGMASAAQQFVGALEEVADAVPKSSDIHSNQIIENLDFLGQLSQIIANNYENWGNVMEEKVCSPMNAILQSVPLQAAQMKCASVHQNSRRMMFKRNSIDTVRSRGRGRAGIGMQEAIDKISHEAIPSVMNLLSKQLDSQLDAVETTNEAIQKIEIDANRSLKMSSSGIPHVVGGRYASDESDPILPSPSPSPSFSPEKDKDFNIDFLKRLLDAW